MADDLEVLVAALSVEVRGLKKQLENASGVFDKETLRMEKRAAKFHKELNAQLSNFTGLSSLKSSLVGLTAVGVAGGLFAIIDKGLKAAAAIKEMSPSPGLVSNGCRNCVTKALRPACLSTRWIRP